MYVHVTVSSTPGKEDLSRDAMPYSQIIEILLWGDLLAGLSATHILAMLADLGQMPLPIRDKSTDGCSSHSG